MPARGCLRGDAGGGITRSRASCVVGKGEYIGLSLGDLKLEARTEVRETTSY